jgi:hypothetical protein
MHCRSPLMARKPTHAGSTRQLRPVERRVAGPSIGLGGRTAARALRSLRRERKCVERNRDRVAVTWASDECGSVVHADEADTSVSVHYGLFRLKVAGRSELQLQELRARDGFKAERVHARKVRRRLCASSTSSEVEAVAEDGAIDSRRLLSVDRDSESIPPPLLQLGGITRLNDVSRGAELLFADGGR